MHLSIKEAGLKDLCSCPKCGYLAVVPNRSSDRSGDNGTRMALFDCPVDGCKYKSCANCGMKAHSGKTCEEAAAWKTQRVRVEEAQSEAKMRRCPSCSKAIVKSEGCNFMRCPCGTKFCYVCRSKIEDHSHFTSTNSRCLMYTLDQDATDEEAMRQAAAMARGERLPKSAGDSSESLSKNVRDSSVFEFLIMLFGLGLLVYRFSRAH